MNRLGIGPVPPSRMDQLKTRPFEFAIAAYGIIGGALIISDQMHMSRVLKNVEYLGDNVLLALGVLLAVGGAFIIKGLLDVDVEDILVAWKAERTGLVLSATAWLVYFVFAVGHAPLNVPGWMLPLMFVGACVFRYLGTMSDEKRMRETLGDTNEGEREP